MIYDFLAYCFIPAASVWFAWETDWTATNFSVLRNSGEKELLFLSWGTVLILCFSLWFGDLSRRLSPARAASALVHTACLALILAMATPYLPERFPFWSQVHFFCAFLSPVFFLCGLLLLLLSYRRKNPVLARRFLLGFWTITAVSLILLLKYGMVTSGLEIFFGSACSVFLRRFHQRVVR